MKADVRGPGCREAALFMAIALALSACGGGGGGGTSQILDSFEGSEGHFNTSPTYSGSTVGISTSSTADFKISRSTSGSSNSAVIAREIASKYSLCNTRTSTNALPILSSASRLVQSGRLNQSENVK